MAQQISNQTLVPTDEDIKAAVATQMAYDAAERSTEGAGTLARNVVVGMVSRYGFPWWAGAWTPDMGESPFYAYGIPPATVAERCFGWDVLEEPLESLESLASPGSGEQGPVASRPVPGWKVLRRSTTGAVLHVAKTSHRVHGFRETLIEGFSTIVQDALVFSSAGTLRGGRVGWTQIETDALEHASGAVIRPHAMFTTSHDQSLVTSCRENMTNVKCDNSHRRCLGEAIPVWTMRHTKNSRLDTAQVEKARRALGLFIEKSADAWTIELDLLTREPVTDAEFAAVVADLAPLRDDDGNELTGASRTLAAKKRDELTAMWVSDPRVSPWAGTAWGVVQAVNTWQTHKQTVRNAHHYERQMMNAIHGDTGDALALDKLNVVKAGGIQVLRDRATSMERHAGLLETTR